MKSQAVVNFSSKPGSVEIQEIGYPHFGDDDVIMQVEAVSVCGSDLHQWHGTNSWEVSYPVVLIVGATVAFYFLTDYMVEYLS